MKPIRIPSSPAKRIRIFLLAICILAMLWGLWHTMKFYIIPEARAAWQANLLSRENPFLTCEPGTHKLFDISPEDVEELGQVYGGKKAAYSFFQANPKLSGNQNSSPGYFHPFVQLAENASAAPPEN